MASVTTIQAIPTGHTAHEHEVPACAGTKMDDAYVCDAYIRKEGAPRMGEARCSPRQLDEAHGERGRVGRNVLDLNASARSGMDVFAISQIDARVVDTATTTPEDEVTTLSLCKGYLLAA